MFLKKNKIIIVLISVFFSLFLLSYVFATYQGQPSGTVNLLVGHYFEDYFEYLSFMKQGQDGNLILKNYFANRDDSPYFVSWWPYSVYGFMTSYLSVPITILYWVFSFLLLNVYFLLIYHFINLLVSKKTKAYKLAVFLLVLLSAGVFSVTSNLGIKLTYYDFWYSIGMPFNRFCVGTPHQLLTHIIFLASLIFVFKYQKLKLWKYCSVITFLSLILFSLSPAQFILFWLTYFCSFLVYYLFLVHSPKNIQRLVFSLGISALAVLPFAILIKNTFSQAPVMILGRVWDVTHLYYPSFKLFAFTMGYTALLAPFGLYFFLRKMDLGKCMLLGLAFWSCLFSYIYIPDISNKLFWILGMHNLRFQTPLLYVLLAICTVELITVIFSKKKYWKYFIIIILLLTFLPTIFSAWSEKKGAMLRNGNLEYMNIETYQGIMALCKLQIPKDQAILTSSGSGLGVVIPAFCSRKVYLGRSIFSYDLNMRHAITNEFYTMKMKEQAARQFLERENIGFIVAEREAVYPFLQKVFDNGSLKIYTYNK